MPSSRVTLEVGIIHRNIYIEYYSGFLLVILSLVNPQFSQFNIVLLGALDNGLAVRIISSLYDIVYFFFNFGKSFISGTLPSILPHYKQFPSIAFIGHHR